MPFFATASRPAFGRRFGLIAVTALVVAVSACLRQETALPMPPVLPHPGDCGAGGLTSLTGQHFSHLADAQLPGALRVLHPMQAITMDFSPSRLNVRVDDAGIIRSMQCG